MKIKLKEIHKSNGSYFGKNLDQRLETVLLHHNAIRKGLGKNIFKKMF